MKQSHGSSGCLAWQALVSPPSEPKVMFCILYTYFIHILGNHIHISWTKYKYTE